jgi:hypothetical protein
MNLLTASIRSQRDLRRHLRDAREVESPLDFLSPRAKRLSTLDQELRVYSKAADECSSGDEADYHCVARATCGSRMRYICKASC